MPRGGPRPGSGRKVGSKEKHTIAKEKALKVYDLEMMKKIKPVISAQYALATGLTVMLRRKKIKGKRTGEFVRVMDANEIERLLNKDCTGEDFYIISAKDPNVKAQEDIFNRLFGKPKESLALSDPDGEALPLIAILKTSIEKTYGNRSNIGRRINKDR